MNDAPVLEYHSGHVYTGMHGKGISLMRKSVYFAAEVLWTLIVSSVIWFLFFKTVSFDFYHISDDSIAGIILFIGLILYVILTVCYIILGFKKVKEWHGRMSIIAVIISAAMGFAGSLVVLYGSELLNGLIH